PRARIGGGANRQPGRAVHGGHLAGLRPDRLVLGNRGPAHATIAHRATRAEPRRGRGISGPGLETGLVQSLGAAAPRADARPGFYRKNAARPVNSSRYRDATRT